MPVDTPFVYVLPFGMFFNFMEKYRKTLPKNIMLTREQYGEEHQFAS